MTILYPKASVSLIGVLHVTYPAPLERTPAMFYQYL